MKQIARRLPRASTLIATALVAALAIPVAATAAPDKLPAFARNPNGISVLGRLPEPSGNGLLNQYVIQVDSARQRMYYLYERGVDIYIREYDLRSAVPTLAREVYVGTTQELPLGATSPYTIQIDEKHHRLMMLTNALNGSHIAVVDLQKFKVQGIWDVGTILPAFVGQGMTYSRKDDRLYILGSQSGNVFGSTNPGVAKPSQVAAVAALDVSGDSPSLAWFRPIPQCQQVMDTFNIGALIARSTRQDALYFACVRADPWPGESGVVRVGITPDAGAADAAAFPVDFFPVSGSFTDTPGIVGVAAFDYGADRLYVQSLAFTTPGAWVFDGRLSAWVGFVAAPDHRDWFLGLDQKSHHYYVVGSDAAPGGKYEGGYVLVADGSATPIPQGEVFPQLGSIGFVAVDSATHRLFARVKLAKLGLVPPDSTEVGYIVLEDSTPLEKPASPLDYDKLTTDMPEGPNTVTNFSGDVNGYGARAILVGGYGGVFSASGQPLPAEPVRSGDRGFTAARIPSVDLRNAGSSATAQPLVADANTDTELNDAGAGEWPWAPATCLDGGGQKLDQASSGPGGESSVHCDLTKSNTTASSKFGAFSAGGVSIASSSFDAATWRDPKDGVHTRTVAIAKGVELAAPDGQTVSIGQVSAVAETVAHGRPGTAKVTWERMLSGVAVTDAEGNETQLGGCSSSDDPDTCGPIVDQVNDVLQTRMRINLPRPVTTATPKGAFASVQQSDRDFYEGRTVDNQGTTFSAEAVSRAVPALQVKVFNDSAEKSRVLVQLAALQASSIYTNSAPPAYDSDPPAPPAEAPGDGGGASAPAGDVAPASSGGLGAAATGPALEQAAGGGGSTTPIQATAVAAQAPSGVLAFLTRGPKEALLFAGVWLLFGAAGAAILRRRSLLGVLTGDASR